MPSETTAGSRIKKTREKLGMTLPQLAGRIGVQRKTVENWEEDRTGPRGDKLTKLAGVLQVSMVWLLTGDTPQCSNDDLDVKETKAIKRKLAQAIAMQHEIAALLIDVSADVTRLQRDLDEEQELAA